MKCKKILSFLLAVVMILGVLPMTALAAEQTWTDQTVEGNTFTDVNADPNKSYKYTITGSDGSTQTVVVPAADAAGTGNSVKKETTGGVYYQKVDNVNNAQNGVYLLVFQDGNGSYAVKTDLGVAENVAIDGNTINTPHSSAEWTVQIGTQKLKFLNGTQVMTSTQNGSRESGYSYEVINIKDTDKWNNWSVHTGKGAFTLSRAYTEEYQKQGWLGSYWTTRDVTIYLSASKTGPSVTKDASGTSFQLFQKINNGEVKDIWIVDTTGLENLIAKYEAENLVAENYTKASWNNYQDALEKANAALANESTKIYSSSGAANEALAVINDLHNALIAAHDALMIDDTKPIVTIPQISWTRTKDDTNNTVLLKNFANFDGAINHQGTSYKQYTALTWNWSQITTLINDEETKQKNVWNYTGNSAIRAATINTGVGNGWTDARVHKISGVFEWPAEYDLNDTTIVLESVNDDKYTPIYNHIKNNNLSQYFPNGKVLPVNDDVYVVMWVEGADGSGKPTAANINDYLAFWTGSSGKGIWSERAGGIDDWTRTEPATFLESSQQGVRSFHNSKPNAVGVQQELGNNNVELLSQDMQNLLAQTEGWYTLTDTAAVNSVMRNNYKTGIPAGAKVHLDLYVHNNSNNGGIDELQIKLEKLPTPKEDITVNYYFGAVTNPSDKNNFLGSTTILDKEVGEQITLVSGTNANQLNHKKAAAIAIAKQAVNDGVQVGGTYTVVEGTNTINVLYTATGINYKVFTYDFGTTNVYNNIYTNGITGNVRTGAQLPEGLTFENNTITYKPQNAAQRWVMLPVDVIDQGVIYQETIYLITASNVLYEEDFITSAGAVVKGDIRWHTVNAAAVKISDNDKIPYGYTEAYKDKLAANGYHHASLSEDQFTEKLQFKFHGNGFDLISACGPDTGKLIVRVDNDAGEYVKAFIVDTVLNDNGKTFNQVPVVHMQGLKDGHYTVSITGTYADRTPAKTLSVNAVSGMDAAENYKLMERMGLTEAEMETVEFIGGNDIAEIAAANGMSAMSVSPMTATNQKVYVDGFRVYRPTDNISYAEKEKDLIYTNVMDEAITGNFSAYVEKGADGTYNVTTYEAAGGPENELYLPAGTGIVFGTDATYAQVSLRAVDGVTKANDSIELTHNTEMYYEVKVESGMITITNTGNQLLAIGNLKTNGKITSIQNKEKAVQAVAAFFAMPEEDVFTPAVLRGSIRVSGIGRTRLNTLTVTASSDVAALTVDGKTIRPVNKVLVDLGLADEYVYKVFKRTNRSDAASFEVVAYDANGLASEPVIIHN